MNWRSPLWLCAIGALVAGVVLVLGVRRHSFDLELVEEYTGDEAESDVEPQTLDS